MKSRSIRIPEMLYKRLSRNAKGFETVATTIERALISLEKDNIKQDILSVLSNMKTSNSNEVRYVSLKCLQYPIELAINELTTSNPEYKIEVDNVDEEWLIKLQKITEN